MNKKTYANPQDYHRYPNAGKLEIRATKPLSTQDDLSLAYSPGVAEISTEVAENEMRAYRYTAKGNLVGVISNGTAVLGLGNIGALASKPVMEGKAVLFKKFAGIDVFDIEVDEEDPETFVDTVERLAPTFGGINLEDIKAPECFYIEQELSRRLDIPVFHDDQHGTAIIVAAAFENSILLTGKKKEDVKIVICGAGAAGLSCAKLLHASGALKENIMLVDRSGVVHKGRDKMNEYIEEFAVETNARTLADAVEDADYFFGLSAGGVLKKEMVQTMAKKPCIFAMANPTPEITPAEVAEVRDDAIVGTGRSDYANQVNNVLVFPYMFRGALDCRAKEVNMEMKLAAAKALAELARKEADESLSSAYKGATLKFGKDYIIPKPFDTRLAYIVPPAVAKAAMETGVARKEIDDLDAYAIELRSQMDTGFTVMQHIHTEARKEPKRVCYPDAEDQRVLRAAQVIVNEGIARPILIGRPDVIRTRIAELGLSIKEGEHYDLVDPNNNPKHEEYAREFYEIRKRSGLLPPEAEIVMRSRWAATAAMMVRQGDADAMVSGVSGRFDKFLRQAVQIIGPSEGSTSVYGLQLFMDRNRMIFLGDTHVNTNPTAVQIAEMALLAADEVRHFGIKPRIALISHSHFGSSNAPEAVKMREALELIQAYDPELEVEGEMQADAALNWDIMQRTFPDSRLTAEANILLMPGLDAANIAYNLLRVTGEGETVGPVLLGMDKPVHILSTYCSVRQIVNMTSLSVVEAQSKERRSEEEVEDPASEKLKLLS